MDCEQTSGLGVLMFRSIRWRLVASYTLMTILAVTLVGVLALFLIERYLLRQEHDYLTLNATAVAQQLEPLLRAPLPQPALADLARTTAFLSDVQVRILDAQEQILVDSGAPSQLDGMTWLRPATEAIASTTNMTGTSASSGVFVQVLPDQPDEQSSLHWQKTVTVEAGSAPPLPPLVVFRRSAVFASDPALWPQPEAPLPADTISIVAATPPLVAPAAPAAPLPITDVHQLPGWPALHAFFAPVAMAPQRVVQAVSSEQGVVGYVELSSGPDFATAALALIRRAFLLAGAGVSLLAMFVALWMSRTLTAPLHDLTQVTNQMRSGALSARAAVRTQDEIGLLATQFNTMATQLERSFAELAAERDALRRFVADASHELRTPMTALKTFIELLLGPAGASVSTRSEFLQQSQQQLQRLEWTTSALLQLSRLDAGLTDLKAESLDLRDLLAPTLKPFAVRAQEKSILLTLAPSPAPVLAVGNAAYLEMALGNLIDNALKFTPSGGAIELSATLEASAKLADATDAETTTQPIWATLTVQDNGMGIAPEDQPYVFDRFYRGHHSVSKSPDGTDTNRDLQSQTSDEAGCGLGLAIVQSIVKAHGGQVTVASAVGVGSRFVVQVPSAAVSLGHHGD